MGQLVNWYVINNEGLREHAKKSLDYLVSGTYVCQVYGFDIEEVEQRIEDRTMVGFRLGFLGPWLPEWQFVETDEVKAVVSPLAIEMREAWGEFNLGYFVEVMATHIMENVPIIGQESIYGEMVQLGLNPLDDSNTRSLFRQSGGMAAG